MKKVIFSLLLAFGMIATVNAQKAKYLPIVTGDTVIASSSLDTVFKSIPATGSWRTLTVGIDGTKVSGTITAKAYLYGSLNGGLTYNLLDSTTAFANSAGLQTKFIEKTTVGYDLYRVQVRQPTSAGSTESLAVKVWYLFRP